MCRFYLFAKEFCITGIVLPRHDLDRRRRPNIFHDTDVGGDTLIGIGMNITFLFARQQRQNIRTQNIGRQDDNGFALFSDLHLPVLGEHLIENKAVRFRCFDITVVVKVESVILLDRPDGLRVSVNQQIQLPRLPGGIVLKIESLPVKKGIRQGL